MKILLCDDSRVVRKKLSQSIKAMADYDIIEATNGQMAVDAYHQLRPELVLMDILMPVMDGLSAVESIIMDDPEANIVMLSSLGTKENLQKALEAGAKDFVQKPVDDERLKQLLETYGRRD